MPNRRSSKIRDLNQIATELLEEAVGRPAPITPVGKKNPAAARRAAGLKQTAVRPKGSALKKRKAVARKVAATSPKLKQR